MYFPLWQNAREQGRTPRYFKVAMPTGAGGAAHGARPAPTPALAPTRCLISPPALPPSVLSFQNMQRKPVSDSIITWYWVRLQYGVIPLASHCTTQCTTKCTTRTTAQHIAQHTAQHSSPPPCMAAPLALIVGVVDMSSASASASVRELPPPSRWQPAWPAPSSARARPAGVERPLVAGAGGRGEQARRSTVLLSQC